VSDDRWQRVKDVMGGALQRPPESRVAYLREACAGDEGLRREVESLLAASSDAGDFFSAPAGLKEGRAAERAARRLAVGTRLGPYEIVSFIGAGGMGEVYRARDPRLDRTVAIKVLPQDLAADADRLRRFEHEARASGTLDHPNILAVHDVGTHDGIPYMVTELLEGEPLSEAIRKGSITRERAAEYAAQVADGLAAAHERGVVHRDVKPDNLFVTTDGRIKILDFGLARLGQPALAQEAASTFTALTRPGTVLGTVGYMSPEQLRGETADARSDVFALGGVLYEMHTGVHPFRRGNEAETVHAILKEEPLAGVPARGLPLEIRRIVRRCLAKRPEDRYQSARDAARDLRSAAGNASRRSRRRMVVLVVAAGALLSAAGLALLQTRGHPPPAPTERTPVSGADWKSVAVLPFQNLSPDPENAYFADGMTEDILTQLAKIQDLKVIARTSVMRYKGTEKPVREIARELGVGAVLEGSVRRAGNRVRIAGQLIDASTEQHLWAETYDRDLQDVFAVQSDVAQRIADALQAKLTAPEKQRIEARPTRSVEAYDLYLQGRELYNRFRKDDNEQAIVLFQKAVALDPQFALGWAGLGDATGQRAARFGFPRSWLDSGLEASRTALRIDPTLAEGYKALGVNLFWKGRIEEGLQATRKAVELKPSYNPAVANTGFSLFFLGRLDEAVRWHERSVELDPRSGLRTSFLGSTYDALGDPARAEATLRRALELQPEIGQVNWYLVTLYLRQGRRREALALARKALVTAPDDPATIHAAAEAELMAGEQPRAQELYERLLRLVGAYPGDHVKVYLAYLYRRRGRTKDAEKLLDETLELHQRLVASGNEFFAIRLEIAFVHAARGETDEAMRWLERAQQAGWRGWPEANWSPLLDPLRSDARFLALMQGIDRDVAEMRRKAGLG
jgi:serine/threonine protein kinase/tetratricopeptide (TPR) repeat protein